MLIKKGSQNAFNQLLYVILVFPFDVIVDVIFLAIFFGAVKPDGFYFRFEKGIHLFALYRVTHVGKQAGIHRRQAQCGFFCACDFVGRLQGDGFTVFQQKNQLR
jgi:hypothetical protein